MKITMNKKTSENITKKDLDGLINPVEVVVPQVVNNEDPVETTSLDTSMNDNDSAESDDEASFGTPDDSPKSKRKSPKGKYGKGKAPPPPSTTQQSLHQVENSDGTKNTRDVQDGTEESLFEFVKTLPNTGFKETGKKGLQVVNPIAEKKLRHKSKSPGRIPKSGSGLGKLLQFPGKLAFWKNDDKTKDTISTSSGDHSRRSSTIERTIDDFQSCNDLNELLKKSPRDDDTADDHLSFKDAEIGSEIISQDIIDKSDELQKLIEAKIESHPEYKYLSLHGNTGEIPSSSKSTDV
uniref:Uncharacterized protein n=1 Tax=Pectinophora gossypiella TaxID=13191 RepID=A0A1E1W7M8_PECGO